MKKIYLLIAVIGGLFMSSCQEQDIPFFGAERFVYFEKFWKDASYPGTEKADSTDVTFFFVDEDATSTTADIVVVLAGRALEKDLNFKLRVVDDMTTALPNEYVLAENYTFRALPVSEGAVCIQDTIHIQLNKSSRLDELEDGYRLVVEFVPTEDLKVGQYERSRSIIHITKDPVRPEWWTKEIETTLFGKYSPKKYKLMLENIPGADELSKELIDERPDMARKIALDFKKWLMEYNSAHPDEPMLDEDGWPMEVPV